jgi:ABC-type amino acid transport system permease subunit
MRAGVMLAIWHDPATLDEWRNSGGLDEAFVNVPLKVVAIGSAMGILGALFGKGVATMARNQHGRGWRKVLVGVAASVPLLVLLMSVGYVIGKIGPS